MSTLYQTQTQAPGQIQVETQTLPVIDAGPFFEHLDLSSLDLDRSKEGLERLTSSPRARALAREIESACHKQGMFYLIGHSVPKALMMRVMAANAYFFNRPQEEKDAISIKNSPHFRGYGLLKNHRDWREQIHLGFESREHAPTDTSSTSASRDKVRSVYQDLSGPNQWPLHDLDGTWRSTMLEYFWAIQDLSTIMLALLAVSLGKPVDYFSQRMGTDPYLLIKSMSYLPQPAMADASEARPRSGVTAHCDWSWLTFLMQDDVGGLEGQDIYGRWHQVTPLDGSFVVNTGELLEIETGGHLRACPHRVINERIDRQRYSVPVFINPALDSQILAAASAADYAKKTSAISQNEHVHKVVAPGTRLNDFCFGESEWQRKAQGQWCFAADCCKPL